jgi:aspartate 1-decarboxylase
MRKMLKSKIHRATITHANLDYEGSITISPELLKASNILEFEAVNVWNVTSGTRFETYAIVGEDCSNAICVNGAAAHLVNIGDLIIIASFSLLPEEKCHNYNPTVIFVNENNQIVAQRSEVAALLD